MAHKVSFELPVRQLGRADVEFRVQNDGTRFGRLLVSKGNIVWRARNQHRGKKLSWKRLNELMQEHGRDER